MRRRAASMVIPTLNEVEGIRALLPQIQGVSAQELIVVDGGSTDGTVEILQKAGIKVTSQNSKGRGSAIRQGVVAAKHDSIVIFSPDGNENPEDVEMLLDLLDGGADLAIASRFLPESRNEEDDSLLPLRALANRLFTWIANVLWNRDTYVTDTINGYRAFRRKIFEQLGIDAPGFVIEYQMTIRAMKLGLKIREIPTREGNRIGGKSKSSSVPTGVRFLKSLVREIWIGKSWR